MYRGSTQAVAAVPPHHHVGPAPGDGSRQSSRKRTGKPRCGYQRYRERLPSLASQGRIAHLRPRHGDDLAPSPDEVGQQPGLLVWKRPRLKVRCFGKMRNDTGINGIGLGTLADRLGEGTDLHRVDDCHRQSSSPQAGGHHGLKAASRLQRNNVRRELAQPCGQLLHPGCITVNGECFSTWAHDDIEAVLRNVDTNNNPIPCGQKIGTAAEPVVGYDIASLRSAGVGATASKASPAASSISAAGSEFGIEPWACDHAAS